MIIGLISIAKLTALLAAVGPALIPLAAPNEEGVAMGHVHLVVSDMEAAKKFWATLGGEVTTFGPFAMIKFPGALVLLRQGEPTGPAAGSTVNHVAFQVPNLAQALDRWHAAGIKSEPGPNPLQAYVIAPDGLLRVEISEIPGVTVPIAFHHVHFFVDDKGPGSANGVLEMQSWYARTFGAKPGKRMHFDAADVPGANLTFSKSPAPTSGTDGRSVDHISFEIADLPAFLRKLEAAGVKLDVPFTERPDLGINYAFFTDPWGTKIELTQGVRNL